MIPLPHAARAITNVRKGPVWIWAGLCYCGDRPGVRVIENDCRLGLYLVRKYIVVYFPD